MHALEVTKQQLLVNVNTLESLRLEYEALINRHNALQDKMDQLVAMSVSGARPL